MRDIFYRSSFNDLSLAQSIRKIKTAGSVLLIAILCLWQSAIVAQCPSSSGMLICETSTTPIDLDNLISNYISGGSWITNPVGASFNAASGVFNPSGHAPGTYNFTYSYPTSGSCIAGTVNVGITINDQPSAGANNTVVVCTGADVDLQDHLNGADPGGTWTDNSGSGGFNPMNNRFNTTGLVGTYNFTYSFSASGGCAADDAVLTVQVVSSTPNAGADRLIAVCETSSAVINLNSLLSAGSTPNGFWSSSASGFNANAETFDPSGNIPGDYTFTYSFLNCGESATITISIENYREAGDGATLNFCNTSSINVADNGAATTFRPGSDNGGIWTASVNNPVGGTTIPAGAPLGTYVFTYSFSPNTASCPGDQATTTINIVDQPFAGTDQTRRICNGATSTIDLSTILNDEDQGGLWLQTAGPVLSLSGSLLNPTGVFNNTYIFTYTIAAANGCAQDIADVIVIAGTQPEAGTGAAVSLCTNSSDISSFDLTGGGSYIDDAGGVWIDNNTSGIDLSDPTNVDLSGLATGTYQYTYGFSSLEGCQDDFATVTVTIVNSATNRAGTGSSTTICDSQTSTINLYSLVAGEFLGGTWAQTNGSGGTFNAAAGTFNPTGVDHNFDAIFTYTFGDGCVATEEATVTIFVSEYKTAGTGGTRTICSGATTAINLTDDDLLNGEDIGGSWSQNAGNPSGGTFNAAAGTFDPTGASAGTYNFQYFQSANSGCASDQATATIIITNTTPDAGDDNLITVCTESTAVLDLNILLFGADANGTWIVSSGSIAGTILDLQSGILDLNSTTSTGTINFQYGFGLVGGTNCTSSVANITVTLIDSDTRTAGTGSAIAICTDGTDIDLYGLLSGESAGGQWTYTGPGATPVGFNPNTGTFTTDISTPGVRNFTYSFAGSGICSPSSATVQVNVLATNPSAGTAINSQVCANDGLLNLHNYLSGETSGGIWAAGISGSGGTFDAAAGTFDVSGASGVFSFTYEFTTANGCAAAGPTTVFITVTAQPDPGDGGSTTVCMTDAAFNLDDILVGASSTDGMWNEVGTSAGNPFNGADLFTPGNAALNTTYTFRYSFPAQGNCAAAEAFYTVSVINSTPLSGATAVNGQLCLGHPTLVNLFDYISGAAPGGTWRDRDNALGGGALSIIADGSAIDLSNTAVGSYEFRYFFDNTALSCIAAPNPRLDFTIDIVEGASAGNNATITICTGPTMPDVNLYALLGASADLGGTWTNVNGANVTGFTTSQTSSTDNENVDFNGSSTGTFIFRYTQDNSDPCSDDLATVTIKIRSDFQAGADNSLTICDGVGLDMMVNLESLLSGEDVGGTWIDVSLSGVALADPTAVDFSGLAAGSYVFNYGFAATDNCEADYATITIVLDDSCDDNAACICAERFDGGSEWNADGTVNDNVSNGGIVKCGSTESVMNNIDANCNYDSDNFVIDLTGSMCYDPATGIMMEPNNPQEGEEVLWINFDVRPFVTSFELQVNDDEEIAWALYQSNAPTSGVNPMAPNQTGAELSGNCGLLSLVKCGVASGGMWNTIMVDAGQYETASNYYIAIWDQSDNTILDDVKEIKTRMGCENDDMCSVFFNGTPRITENGNNTYTVEVEIMGVNGEYILTDPNALVPQVGPICLNNYGTSPTMVTAAASFTYMNNTAYNIQVTEVSPSTIDGCAEPVNSSDSSCNPVLAAPPAALLVIECRNTNGGTYGSFAALPAPNLSPYSAFSNPGGIIQIIRGCGSLPNTITAGDIITQTGPLSFSVERVYTIKAGCRIPGSADDESRTCSQFFTVNIPPVGSTAGCDLGCNDYVQISLDGSCEVLIVPDMILEGNQPINCNYFITIEDPLTGKSVPNPVSSDYIGKELKVRINLVGASSTNSCWGMVLIEDKLRPVIECPDAVTISCNAPDPALNLAIYATDYCDPDLDIQIVEDIYEDYECIDPRYVGKRTVTFVAIDNSGNISLPCEYMILYEKRNNGSIVWGRDYTGLTGQLNHLTCGNGLASPSWDKNGDGYPQANELEGPTIDGRPIYPNTGRCKIQLTYSDQVIPICANSYKIIRHWTALDWCASTSSTNPIYDFQIIKVLDDQGPISTCPQDQTVYSNPYTCSANVSLDPPISVYDCSDNVTYSVAVLLADNNGNPPVDGVYVGDDVVYTLDQKANVGNLPGGKRTWIRYTLYDECGNTGNCFTEIDVKDNVPPIPVCDEFTVVSLTTNNAGRVYAETFDDGSHDNCSEVTFMVARMGSTNFGPYIDFGCADVGNDDLMVVLKVTDTSGNTNTCMVSVEVQDKIGPQWVFCPENVSLECTNDIVDIRPEILGFATASDNCPGVVVTHRDVGGLNQCGVGTFVRIWTATDKAGRSITKNQAIVISNANKFTGPTSWPSDRNLTGCHDASTDPSTTGEPLYGDDHCSILATTYEDQVFEFVEDACFKILRRWTIIDWCQYVDNVPTSSNPGIFRHTQIIKVNDYDAPVFSAPCHDVTVNGETAACAGEVTVKANITDCTPYDQLAISYKVDYGNNGSFEITNGVGGVFNRNDVPFGTHKIVWTAEDKCGNESTCTGTFTVQDKKKPTPYCLGGITTVIMPEGGYVDIWANDFNIGSYDNCPDSPLTFRMRLAGTTGSPTPGYTFYCEDRGTHELEIWVYDGSGNSDFCITTIMIQDNGSCANASSGVIVSGSVMTEMHDAVDQTMVMLENASLNSEGVMNETSATGEYAFDDVNSNANYGLTASRKDDYLNGVSTLDLVMIQRHILGISLLDSPYKVIAADINNNKDVSATDLVQLRKLILGLIEEFPDNESWRFVNANQNFADNRQPWNYMESISLEQLQSDMYDNNFVGIKIGDVNNNAKSNKFMSTEVRNGLAPVILELTKEATSDKVTDMTFQITKSEKLYGFQFTVAYDPAVATFVEVLNSEIGLTSDNIGVQMMERGLISISWNATEAEDLNDLNAFTLRFKNVGKNSIKVEDIAITSSVTTAEAYDLQMNTRKVELREKSIDPEHSGEISLYQNTPNPFDNHTTVSFYLPESGEAVLSVYDVAGKRLFEITKSFNKGLNHVELTHEVLKSSGVMYYQLEKDGFRITKKMISIK